MITKKDVVKYYIALFNRIPEKEAVDSWYDQAIKNGWDEVTLTSSLLDAAISVVNSFKSLQEIYPQYVNFSDKNFNSIENIIESVYKSLFDKTFEDDPRGIIDWTIKVFNNEVTLSEAIVSIEHFAENVYNNKINLKDIGYTDEEISNIKNAVNTYQNRVEYAYKVSNIIDEIKVDNVALKFLQESINMIHSKNDYTKATIFLEKNLSDIVSDEKDVGVLKNKLNNILIIQNDTSNNYAGNDSSNDIGSLLESTENIGFIDLPIYTEIGMQEIVDIHYI